MTTYVYETIPTAEGEAPEVFELKQSMSEPALTSHPTTGQPIRRVISGGFGMVKKGSEMGNTRTGNGAASCGAGCGCHPG